jgi:flagellar L-ring protein precursor FlgH
MPSHKIISLPFNRIQRAWLTPSGLVIWLVATTAWGQSSSLFQHDIPVRGQELTLQTSSFYFQKAEPVRVLKLNDIIRVRVVESSQLNAQGNINRRKQYQLQAQLFDWVKFNNGNLVTNPNSTGDPTINGVLQGQGQARANLETKEGMQFTIAARIVDIRPNGHLVIEAHSMVQNNEEIWDQSLSGIVPPDRVDPKGEVRSEDVAELMIHKQERGQVRDGYRRGWMYWLLDRYGMF